MHGRTRSLPSTAAGRVLQAVRGGEDVAAVAAAVEKATQGDLDVLDEDGFACLHHVALLLKPEAGRLVDVLVGAGAAVDVRDLLGETPLIVAAHYANAPVIERLLACGADPRLTDRHGRTALDYLTSASSSTPAAPGQQQQQQQQQQQRWRRHSHCSVQQAEATKEAVSAAAARGRCVSALRAVLTAPTAWERLAALAHEHARAGRAAEALDAYARAVELAAPTASSPFGRRDEEYRAHVDMARCNMRLGRFAAAVSEGVVCTRLEEGLAEGWLLLARGHMHMRDFPRARVAAEEGLRRCSEADPHARDLLRIVALLVERGVPPRPCTSLAPARAALAKLHEQQASPLPTARCAYCLRDCPLPLDAVCHFCACDPSGPGVPESLWPPF